MKDKKPVAGEEKYCTGCEKKRRMIKIIRGTGSHIGCPICGLPPTTILKRKEVTK